MSIAVNSPGAHEVSASRRLVLGAAIVALLATAATAYWLWVLREHRVDFTQRQVRLQTAALAEHASVVLHSVDASLRGTVRDVRESGGVPLEAHHGLRQRVSGNTYLRAISLVGRDGRLLASSWSDPPPSAHIKAGDPQDTSLSLTPPTASPFGGHEAIDLSRGIADGGDVVRVVASVDNAFVGDFFHRVAVADDARAALFALDGTPLGGDAALLGAPRDRPAELRALLARPLDLVGAERRDLFVIAQRLDDLPIIAITSRDRSAVFAPWYDYVASASIALLLMLGVLAFIVRRLQREMHARREVQEALQRTQRLESIGRLAGGIAHDFNNVLALILGFGDLLGRHLARHGRSDDVATQHAAQIVRAGERGRRLVERILAFSSGAPRPQMAVDVDAVVGEAIDLLMASAPPGVRFDRALEAGQARVAGDPAALFEAINNLCANAIHALADAEAQGRTGQVRVATSVMNTAAARTLSHGQIEPGEYVRIAVSDDGIGMPPDRLERLFEPFFTTRQAQGGTGLGLAVVHATVKEMAGGIDVQSTLGGGSTFVLLLPRSHALPATLPATPEVAPRGHGEVVMVVDDEPALVALTEELLAELGYEPAGFRDPRLALDVLRQSPQRFDALLTDQVMPGMAGTELARELHALRPETPILLATGFSNPALAQRAREAGVSVLLHKPLQRGDLARQLAKAFARG